MSEEQQLLVGRAEIAAFLGVEDFRTVERRYIPRGAPVAKIGGQWMASRRKLLEWIEEEIEKERGCKKM